MKISFPLTLVLLAFIATSGLSQSSKESTSSHAKSFPDYKFSLNTTWLSLVNFGAEKTNTHHYEFHLKYKLSPKSRIGLKFATWKLFEPMGIPLWDPHIMKESEFYPGRLREDGLGISYQRMLWKGLFATLEVLPQLKTYRDESKKKVGTGFKLYTSYHVGYHIPMFKNRMFIEPQIHCQYWPIDTNIPASFKVMEDRWNNYFLLEPNIYIGVKF